MSLIIINLSRKYIQINNELLYPDDFIRISQRQMFLTNNSVIISNEQHELGTIDSDSGMITNNPYGKIRERNKQWLLTYFIGMKPSDITDELIFVIL